MKPEIRPPSSTKCTIQRPNSHIIAALSSFIIIIKKNTANMDLFCDSNVGMATWQWANSRGYKRNERLPTWIQPVAMIEQRKYVACVHSFFCCCCFYLYVIVLLSFCVPYPLMDFLIISLLTVLFIVSGGNLDAWKSSIIYLCQVFLLYTYVVGWRLFVGRVAFCWSIKF